MTSNKIKQIAHKFITLIAFMVVLSVSPTYAASFNIPASDDVYLKDSGYSINTDFMLVSKNRSAFLQFDISEILSSLATDSKIKKAYLLLQGHNINANPEENIDPLNEISLYATVPGWDETNGFGYSSGNIPSQSGGSSIGTFSLATSSSTQIIYDLSSYLSSYNISSPLLSFRLSSNNDTITQITPRTPSGAQSSNGPMLIIETMPVPEPSSLLLFGVSSLAGLLSLRKKKI